MMKHVGVIMLVGSICAMALLQGCGGDTLMPSQDNGVGVEESTIEGVVVTGDAAVGSVGTLQETETPVVGAQVRLMLGTREMAMAQTGTAGQFRFFNPETGNYRVEVTPPEGSGLQGAQHQFQHQAGVRTQLRIRLQPEEGQSGEGNIEGMVVTGAAAVGSVGTLQETETPVVGAQVRLMLGTREMAMAQTGLAGQFQFHNPETGNYRVEVTPPEGSGLQAAQHQFQHQAGVRTQLRICLQPEEGQSGEGNIEGMVVTEAAAVGSVGTLQETETPVVGAQVRLMLGTREMAMAQTGLAGQFQFHNPETGNYRVEVTPPEGSGLQAAQHQFQHQAGVRTQLRIRLQPED